MKKIIYYVITTFVSLIIIINLFSIFNLSIFGFRMFKVASGSMRPYLNVGDVIIIKKSKEYNVKDIVTYEENPKAYLTHRVVSIEDNMITTKGDANNVTDTPVNKKDVLGKVVCRFRYVPLILSKPITWCFLFIIGTLLIFIIPDKDKEEKEK